MSLERHLYERYTSPQGAAAYRGKYERSLTRRLSNRRELQVVGAALDQAAIRGPALDCPCGAGRMTPLLLHHSPHVTAVDLSPAMVAEARDALRPLGAEEAGRLAFAEGSADALPFDDGAFDTVLCHRLIHHFDDEGDRARILRELARVARRRVVMSFNDASTFKMAWQQKRRRKRRRTAWTPEAFEGEAAAYGLLLEPPLRRLNGLFSLVAVAVLRVEPDRAA